MNSVIDVKDLSKKYLISHSAQDKNQSFREMLTGKVTTLFNPKSQKSNTEEFWALKDVSFQIDRGERVGIIGRNGAGKSTLLKVLSRITEPTNGTIRINGRVSSLLEVGTGFHSELTGRENIFLNGAILGMSRKEIIRKFEEIVEFAEIEQFLDTPVKRYSSGMFVRLAFAVAAHLEPEILIIDEVLAVGDLAFQQKCIGKMEEVSRGGRTVIFVSHNMETIKHFCNRCILLEKGELVSDGETNYVVQVYASKTLAINNENPVIRDDGGVMTPFVTEVRLENTAGDLQNTFTRGDEIVLILNIDNRLTKEYGLVYFINDTTGQPVYVSASYMKGVISTGRRQLYKIRVSSESLHSGKYYFRFVTHYPGRESYDDLDYGIFFTITSRTEHDEKWREYQFANDHWEIVT